MSNRWAAAARDRGVVRHVLSRRTRSRGRSQSPPLRSKGRDRNVAVPGTCCPARHARRRETAGHVSGGLGVSASPCRPVLRPVAAWDRQPPTRCRLGQDGARAQRGTAGTLNAGYGRDVGPPCTPPERELALRTEDTRGLSPCLGMYASRLVLGAEKQHSARHTSGGRVGRNEQRAVAFADCCSSHGGLRDWPFTDADVPILSERRPSLGRPLLRLAERGGGSAL